MTTHSTVHAADTTFNVYINDKYESMGNLNIANDHLKQCKLNNASITLAYLKDVIVKSFHDSKSFSSLFVDNNYKWKLFSYNETNVMSEIFNDIHLNVEVSKFEMSQNEYIKLRVVFFNKQMSNDNENVSESAPKTKSINDPSSPIKNDINPATPHSESDNSNECSFVDEIMNVLNQQNAEKESNNIAPKSETIVPAINIASKSKNVDLEKKYKRKQQFDDLSFLCIGLTTVLGICALLSYGIYHGATLIEKAQNYNNSATTEQCFVISRESQSCDGGYSYTYTATSEEKCGNQILTYTTSACGQPTREINTSHKCYVTDCEDGSFSFERHELTMTTGIIIIIAMCLLFICPCCVCYCGISALSNGGC